MHALRISICQSSLLNPGCTLDSPGELGKDVEAEPQPSGSAGIGGGGGVGRPGPDIYF